MKGKIISVLIVFIIFAVGWFAGKYSYKSKLQKIVTQVQSKWDGKTFHSVEEITKHLEKELIMKDNEIKELKKLLGKTQEKLGNMERQYESLWNTFVTGTLSGEGNLVKKKEIDKEVSIEKEENKKSGQELTKEINDALDRKDDKLAIKLLGQLVRYGREYYNFVDEAMQRISQNALTRSGDWITEIEISKELYSTVFSDYYKWVIENSSTSRDGVRIDNAITALIWTLGPEAKPFFFEQFKTQQSSFLREKLFYLLASTPEYKSEYRSKFIEVAKNMSENREIRKKIILVHVNDDSSEVASLFNYLKNMEQDEEIKKMVNIITQVKSGGDKGRVILSNGEVLKEGDIIMKIDGKDTSSNQPIWGMRFREPRREAKEEAKENVEIIVKRNGTVSTLTMPRSKLFSELRTTENVYIGSQ